MPSSTDLQLSKFLRCGSQSQEIVKETSLIRKIYRDGPDRFNPHKLSLLTGTLLASKCQMWTLLPVCQHAFQSMAASHGVTHTKFILTPSLWAFRPRGSEERGTVCVKWKWDKSWHTRPGGLFESMWCAITAEAVHWWKDERGTSKCIRKTHIASVSWNMNRCALFAVMITGLQSHSTWKQRWTATLS